MFTKNGNILKINGDWLKPSSYPEPPEPEPYPFEEVTIGTQIWSKPNLDIDDGGEGIHKVDNVTAMGYNLGTQYYYTWDAAVRVCSNIVGWHLPTKDEWEVLINRRPDMVGKWIKSTYGWEPNEYGGNGTDLYGFTALPVGVWEFNNNRLINNGYYTWHWSATTNGTYAYANILQFTGNNAGLDSHPKYKGFVVRLIKDT